MGTTEPIPVIDLFAGPGGLGEGFSALGRPEGTPRFKIRLSVEKDPTAHQTLELRAFFRQFPHRQAPDDYYRHVQGTLSRRELFDAHPDAALRARREAWQAELGKADTHDVRQQIADALAGAGRWALIGGPPCQAYSVVGRSRNKGRRDSDFLSERRARQKLYVEYLQVIADYRPAVFVMENVKGLLSATVQEERIFARILEDLHYPAEALKREGRSVATQHRDRYRIYSLTRPTMFGQCDPADFVVQTERHGVPQARHRIILLGVRDDLPNVAPGVLPAIDPIPAREVLDGLPRLRSGISEGQDSPELWREILRSALKERWMGVISSNGHADVGGLIANTVGALTTPKKGRGGEFVWCDASLADKHRLDETWFVDDRMAGVPNHATRTHMPSDLHRYLYAACFADARGKSPKLCDFPAELLPDHQNVRTALEGGNFADRFRVQLWGRPSTTITCHIAKDGHYYIHPDPPQCRSLTVREAARLQTFPDNYFFCGGRTAQYAQVGNAVPPLLAREIARIVWTILK